MLRPRLAQANKEVFKLEKALEATEGQMSSFQDIARRQIKLLEDELKAAKKS